MELTIYSLCRFWNNGKCSNPITPKLTTNCIESHCAAFEGPHLKPSCDDSLNKQIREILTAFYVNASSTTHGWLESNHKAINQILLALDKGGYHRENCNV